MLVKLRAKRVEKQLRQEDMAEKLGINTVTYGLKENEKLQFNLEEITNIMKIFDCKFEDIFLH